MSSIIDERGFNQGFELTEAQRIRLGRRAAAIAARVSPQAVNQRILEIGCGTGELALELARLTNGHVTGVDLSAKFIEFATAKHVHPRLDFAVADLSKADPSSEADCYDYIVGNGILHHLYHHLDSVLPALYRWLKPNGRLIFWEPNLWNPYVWLIFSINPLRRAARLEPDEMAFTPSFIRHKLERAGFAAPVVATRDFLLPNTPDSLIKSVVAISNVLDQVPLVRRTAQSLFIEAARPMK